MRYIREPGHSLRRPWKSMSQLFFPHVAGRDRGGASDLPLAISGMPIASLDHDWIFTGRVAFFASCTDTVFPQCEQRRTCDDIAHTNFCGGPVETKTNTANLMDTGKSCSNALPHALTLIQAVTLLPILFFGSLHSGLVYYLHVCITKCRRVHDACTCTSASKVKSNLAPERPAPDSQFTTCIYFFGHTISLELILVFSSNTYKRIAYIDPQIGATEAS